MLNLSGEPLLLRSANGEFKAEIFLAPLAHSIQIRAEAVPNQADLPLGDGGMREPAGNSEFSASSFNITTSQFIRHALKRPNDDAGIEASVGAALTTIRLPPRRAAFFV
ncbi:MAG: hypothetical protein OXI87_09505 [Albidovulum sp.]|nr:hypothetical protein [Albidovulum sp.]